MRDQHNISHSVTVAICKLLLVTVCDTSLVMICVTHLWPRCVVCRSSRSCCCSRHLILGPRQLISTGMVYGQPVNPVRTCRRDGHLVRHVLSQGLQRACCLHLHVNGFAAGADKQMHLSQGPFAIGLVLPATAARLLPASAPQWICGRGR